MHNLGLSVYTTFVVLAGPLGVRSVSESHGGHWLHLR